MGKGDEGEPWSGRNLCRALKRVAVTQNCKGFSNKIPDPKDRVDHLDSRTPFSSILIQENVG